jgi:preprotein translocase subunit SecY
VYRFGAQVTLPGIDATKLTNLTNQTDEGIGWLINVFTGGAFSQASVFALGIMPYISASIVVQLMGIAVPYLQKLQKDGESGRKKINQITRWLTILITLVQGPGYIYNWTYIHFLFSSNLSYWNYFCNVVRRKNY